MKKLKLSTVLDGIFVFIICFFVFYATLKGAIKSIMLTAIISALISAAITFLFAFLSEKLINKRDIKVQDKKEFESFINSLYFAPTPRIKKMIKTYYEQKKIAVTEKKDCLFLEQLNTAIFFEFKPEKTKASTVISAYKKTPKGYKTVFISNGYDLSVKEFFTNFERITLYNGKDFYLALREENLITTTVKPTQRKFKNPFKQILRRENSKKFLRWGAVLLVFSTLTFYKWLYLILGTSFLILSAVTRFFATPSSNVNVNKNLT